MSDADPPHALLPPPPILATGAPGAVLAALPGARAVGGMPRDSLAGLPLHDVDIAVPLSPDEVSARLTAAGLRVFETGVAHGTLTAVLDGEPVEVTSLRRDVATDGRHAEVAWTTDWREDAARRDFTMNAMSLTADGRLWDYFSGRADLIAGRVRFVGDAVTRLREDFLRALRFFRFQARYGRGAPDAMAVAAIRDAVPGLARLSAERVWMELKRLLTAPDPRDSVRLMAELGVLGAVLPEAGDRAAFDRLVEIGAPADPLLRFALLIPPDVPMFELALRLRLSSDEHERLAALRNLASAAPRPGAISRGYQFRAWRVHVRDRSRLVAPVEPLWISQASFDDDAGAQAWADLRAKLAPQSPDESAPVFPLAGRDVLALGVPPGPEVGRLLAKVRVWWIAADCTASRSACLDHLRELAAEAPG